MRRKPVDSSNLKSVGYSPTKKVLEIQFCSKSLYQYTSVPAPIHKGLLAAESKGKFHHREIMGKFPFKRLA